jgi:hypothetical protein
MRLVGEDSSAQAHQARSPGACRGARLRAASPAATARRCSDRVGSVAAAGRLRRRQRLRQRLGDLDLDLRGDARRLSGAVDLPADEDEEDAQNDGEQRPEEAAPDPDLRHGRAEARRRRRIGEAALLEGLDALVENPVGDGQPLALVDLAEALLQRLVAHVLAEFLLDETVLVAERVDHVHREHEVVELRRRRLGRRRRGRVSH